MSENSILDWMRNIDTDLMDAFIDNPYECPIVVDNGGIIRFITRHSAGLYGVSREEALGKHITKVIKNTRLPEIIETGKAAIGEPFYVGGRQQIIARIPLRNREGKVIGALGKGMFHQASRVKDLYQSLEVLKDQLKYYRNEVTSLKGNSSLVGRSALIQEARKSAFQAATSEANVLITGESGTGKEVLGYYIHNNSERASGPFIRVNCAAVPHALFESELFGYERGAFTGARSQGKPGRFELANGGTILLDEIGDMPFDMQVKLLRVIQEREIDRVGGTKPIKLDFRLICATNQDLQKMVQKGAFRMDLYYRINIFHIQTPSLREIPEDIPLIAFYLMSSLKDEMLWSPTGISDEAMELMKRYPWPGNVRELRNVLERTMISVKNEQIRVEDLPNRIRYIDTVQKNSTNPVGSLREILADAEKKAISETLRMTAGNKVKAAKVLGIHRTALYQKIRRYHLDV
ncbi:MAG: sigma 54-interacting transcriptional regulator [Deltaproteobacteria bacterium]|nr:sigma 54-interacting transcriptional regulator [Deltaproteobacteria bacterium]